MKSRALSIPKPHLVACLVLFTAMIALLLSAGDADSVQGSNSLSSIAAVQTLTKQEAAATVGGSTDMKCIREDDNCNVGYIDFIECVAVEEGKCEGWWLIDFASIDKNYHCTGDVPQPSCYEFLGMCGWIRRYSECVEKWIGEEEGGWRCEYEDATDTNKNVLKWVQCPH